MAIIPYIVSIRDGENLLVSVAIICYKPTMKSRILALIVFVPGLLSRVRPMSR